MLSDQVSMELFVADASNANGFYDSNGNYRDVCEWPGVTCNEQKDVKRIEWGRRKGFTITDADFISYTQWLHDPTEGTEWSLSFDFLPAKLTDLSASCIAATGTISTAKLPTSMRVLWCVCNKLSGSFSVSLLPKTLRRLNIAENRFAHELDLRGMPNKIELFDCSWNNFSGSIDLTALSPVLRFLNLSQNEISGAISLACLPDTLELCFLYDNKISQETLCFGRVPSQFMRMEIDANAYENLVKENERPLCSKSVHGKTIIRGKKLLPSDQYIPYKE